MKKILEVIVAFLMILVVAIFGLKDTIIKGALERELTNSFGTNVRIHGVDYSIFKEELDLKGIGIESLENDAYDIVRIGEIKTKLNYKELFNKKLRLNRVDVKDIALNVKTDRENKKKPLLNQRQEIATSKENQLSDKDIQKILNLIVKNYDYLVNSSGKDTETFKYYKKIFLTATAPLANQYVDYKLEEIADKQIYEIIKKYRAVSNNIQINLKKTQDIDWKVEIGCINISTELFGRKFKGVISEFSTDKLKVNDNVDFVLDSLNGKENGKITGSINPYKMKGRIKIQINDVSTNEFEEVAPYGSGYVFLKQNLELDGDQIKVFGNVELKDITLNKKEISKKIFGDEDAIENLQENYDQKMGNMVVSYSYDPRTLKVRIKSNVVDEIGVYFGADSSELDRIKNNLQVKYNNEINKVKNDLQKTLNKFFKVK